MGTLIGIAVATWVLGIFIVVKTIETNAKLDSFFKVEPTSKRKYVKSGKYSHKSKGIRPDISAGVKGYWAKMTPEERKAEGQRRLIVARNNKLAKAKGITVGDVTGKQTGKRNAWQKKRISKGIKAYWDNLTPEQRAIRLDKMRRSRELKKLLKENPSFHTK